MDIDHALTDPGFFANHDPHPVWQQLRRESRITSCSRLVSICLSWIDEQCVSRIKQ